VTKTAECFNRTIFRWWCWSIYLCSISEQDGRLWSHRIPITHLNFLSLLRYCSVPLSISLRWLFDVASVL